MSRRVSDSFSVGTESSGGASALARQSGRAYLPEPGPHERWLCLAACLLLAAAVWAVFGQTLHHDFVNYDDNTYVSENSAISRGLSWQGIHWAFTHVGDQEWFPLTWISRMADLQLYGLNAGGHHFTNVLLHAAATVLLFLVLRKMTRQLWPSAFVAAVFALHPLRVESVAWVTERKDVLSGVFFMLTLWAYVRYAEASGAGSLGSLVSSDQQTDHGPRTTDHARRSTSPAARFYVLALAFFTLGLLAKTMLVTVPFVLLLLDHWPLRRFRPSTINKTPSAFWPLIREKLPFLLLAAAGCVATILTQPTTLAQVNGLSVPWRIGNALMAYADYLGHVVYPVGLAVGYPPPPKALPLARVAVSLLILAIISMVVVAQRRKRPYLLVGWLWYLGMLVPVIDFMQAGVNTRADRFTYLPQIGLCLMLAWGASDLCGGWRYRRPALASAAAVIIAVLLAMSYTQTGYWKDSFSVWARGLACTEQNWLAHFGLGNAFRAQGKLTEAVQQYEQALQLKPEDAETCNNLGIALATQGKVSEAIQQFERTLRIKPHHAGANNNLGLALATQGKLAEATQHYERALQLKPDYADAEFNWGNALHSQGKMTEAIQHFQRALQIMPDHAQAHNNLGVALANQERASEAIEQFERALQLAPDHAEARYNLGRTLADLGKFKEAIPQYERVLQLQPDNAAGLDGLARVLATSPVPSVRDGARAIALAQRASQLAGDAEPIPADTLAAAYAEAGRFAEAIVCAQKALTSARRLGQKELAEQIASRLALYQAGTPYREGPAAIPRSNPK